MTVLNEPSNYSYCFYFSEHDCYKLKTGICSLNLSETEYDEKLKLSTHESNTYAAKVSYCRELADKMKQDANFSSNMGIRAEKYACGHIAFSDGQHRTCISKRLKFPKLELDKLGQAPYLCRVCGKKDKKATIKTIFINKVKEKWFKKNEYDFSKGPVDFIDDELWVD